MATVNETGDLSQQWQTPLNLRDASPYAEFPLDQRPVLIQSAVEEVQALVQAPLGMVASSGLSVVSTCTQSLAAVSRDEILNSPIGTCFMSVAKSGERKTACDKLFTRALHDWERTQKELFTPLQAEYEAQLKSWEAVEQGHLSAIKKAAANGMQLGPDQISVDHALRKPHPPRRPKVMRQDDTPEALALALSRWPCASIMSAEAAIIFGGHGMNPDSVMRNLAQLNIFWDGGPFERDRTTTHSVELDSVRLTCGLMVQPAVLDEFMRKVGNLARGIGYFARFLFCHPTSTQGTRFYKPPTNGTPHLDAFNARVRQLLEVPVIVDENGRLIGGANLTLSPEAKAAWSDFHDSVELLLAPGELYQVISDVASKIAENAARLAAEFNVFMNGTIGTVIGLDHMRSAIAVAEWYLYEALRYAKLVMVPDVVRDAEQIERFLIDQWNDGMKFHTKREIQQRIGPRHLRKNKAAITAALDTLEDHHRIKHVPHGRTFVVVLNPQLVAGS